MSNEEQAAQAYSVLRQYEKPYRLGRFTGIMQSEMRVKSINVQASETTALLWQYVPKDRWIKDFTGVDRAVIQRGDILVTRIGCLPGASLGRGSWPILEAALDTLLCKTERLWVWIWQEDRYLARRLMERGYRHVLLKVTASSEYRALYVYGPRIEAREVPEVERLSLVRLNLPEHTFEVNALRASIAYLSPGFSEHYSHYNKRRSWSAVSLRGFGGLPHLIEKPWEMSKPWRLEHADRLLWICADTSVRAQLPEVEPLLEMLGGPPFQRIRLMKLSKGEGELSRHADITDKEAGTADGRIMRLHIPITTNPGVRFTSWDYEGIERQEHFAAGEGFYLDTRKAHKAINTGEEDRIHLVVDCLANNARRALLRQREGAE